MPTMKLNIYSEKNKNEIEKTYTAETYDLMFGTVEDIIAIVDIDKLNDNLAIATTVIKCWSKLKPFLKDVFPGVTDDELHRVKVKELIPTFASIFTAIVDSFNVTKSGN